MERKWWKEEVIYQIYPKSFKDSNGDRRYPGNHGKAGLSERSGSDHALDLPGVPFAHG